MATLKQQLAPYRKKETPDQLAIVVDNPEAMRLLAAWRRVRFEWSPPKAKKPRTRRELLRWLWQGGRYDLEALAIAAQLGQSQTRILLASLALGGLVYPDGSITKHAAECVADYTRKRYPKRHGSPGRPKGTKNRKPASK